MSVKNRQQTADIEEQIKTLLELLIEMRNGHEGMTREHEEIKTGMTNTLLKIKEQVQRRSRRKRRSRRTEDRHDDCTRKGKGRTRRNESNKSK